MDNVPNGKELVVMMGCGKGGTPYLLFNFDSVSLL